MNLVLLALGLAVTAVGFVTIGFGIPREALSFGNTLIISGTIAAACGFLLIAISVAIGQLRRIAEALNTRGLARATRSEPVDSLVPPTARITPAPAAAPPSPVPTRAAAAKPLDVPEASYPPEPPMQQPGALIPRMPEPPRPAEPRFPATAASEPPGPLDWLRAKSKPAASAPMAEPPMVEVPDEAPLSPRPPQRPAMPSMPGMPEPALEPKVWSPSRNNGATEARPLPRATPQQPEPSREQAAPPFDAVWPERGGTAPAGEAKREARPDMPAVPPAPRRDEKPAERRPDATAKPAGERTPTILKSGVIDGMPYTLYADGSIEAELPQGTVKFASVDALRAHLEKHA